MVKSHLQLKLPQIEDWEQLQDPNHNKGILFCPIDLPPEIGSDVRLEIAFTDGPMFLLLGKVVWRRPHSDPRMHAGAGVQIIDQHRGTLEYIAGWVDGTLTDRRRHPRLPLRLRVIYSAGGRRRINFTRDVAHSGIYVHSSQLLEVDAGISLRLAPPDRPPMDLKGRVARRSQPGEPQGMGIELVFAGAASAMRFTTFVDELQKLLHQGEIPPNMLT